MYTTSELNEKFERPLSGTTVPVTTYKRLQEPNKGLIAITRRFVHRGMSDRRTCTDKTKTGTMTDIFGEEVDDTCPGCAVGSQLR